MTAIRLATRAALAAVCLSFLMPATRADLVRYDMFGQPGDQVSTAPTFNETGVTGSALGRGPGLTPNAGANSINSAGWSTDATDFLVMGFDLVPGFTATVTRLTLAGRSSNTGPGFINIFYAIDGGTETLLTQMTLSGTAFNNLDFLTPGLSATSSFRLYFRAANTTSAAGGTIGSTGTFRLGNFSPDNGTTFVPITIGGVARTAAIPEPSPMLLGLIGLFVVAIGRLRRAA